MPSRVVLIGLPGVGKSSVGVRLARRMSVDFADSDDLVVRTHGREVTDIFATDGEAAFRRLEAAAIATALADFGGVLALGGGAVTTAEVRLALREAKVPVVLLTASQHDLLHRIGATRHRPLLAGDTAARLAELDEERGQWYRDVATLTIDTTGRSLAAVAADLHDQLSGETV